MKSIMKERDGQDLTQKDEMEYNILVVSLKRIIRATKVTTPSYTVS